MNILNMLLPNKFPTAIYLAPILIATKETSSSGRDVAATINNVAKNV